MARWLQITLSVLVGAAIVSVMWLATGCPIDWTRPSNLTLEEKAKAVQIAATAAMSEICAANLGDWQNNTCNLAATVVKALDGDRGSLTFLRVIGSGPSSATVEVINTASGPTITIDMANMMFDLLKRSLANAGLDNRWQTRLEDAIAIFNLYAAVNATTGHEVWFLTRAFFEGITDGCSTTG